MTTDNKGNCKECFKKCWWYVSFWCGSGSSDPYLWLMDPDPDPPLHPTPFFSDFKDANFFHIFFLQLQLTLRHIVFSLTNLIFAKILCSHIFFASIISVRSTPLWEKGRIRISDWLTGSGFGRHKNMWILRIRIWFGIRLLNTNFKLSISERFILKQQFILDNNTLLNPSPWEGHWWPWHRWTGSRQIWRRELQGRAPLPAGRGKRRRWRPGTVTPAQRRCSACGPGFASPARQNAKTSFF